MTQEEDFFYAHLATRLANPPLHSFSDSHSDIVKEMIGLDPIKTMAMLSNLLTVPKLQSNCLRLEVLIHLVLAFSKGSREPTKKQISHWFLCLGRGPCGSQEDPAEDVFVSNISTPKGNFLILEGVWESSGFYLQRIVNAVIDDEQFAEIIYPMLKISDMLCKRAKLQRYQLGGEYLLSTIPSNAFNEDNRVIFSISELEENEIDIRRLSYFLMDKAMLPELEKESLGNTTLERRPIFIENGELVVLLPTAISCAIRRFVIEFFTEAGTLHVFTKNLLNEYANVFSNLPLISGGAKIPVEWQYSGNNFVANCFGPIDSGRYLNYIFFADNLNGFEETGLGGCNPSVLALTKDIEMVIDETYNEVKNVEGFREMLTICVSCGVGRGAAYDLTRVKHRNWKFINISAADLFTLSLLKNFKPELIFKLLYAQEKLKEVGGEVQNINGLLNIMAWVRSNDGNIVSHNLDTSIHTTPTIVVLPTNSILELRSEVFNRRDPHRVRNINGEWIDVIKSDNSLFKEDIQQPLYIYEKYIPGKGIPIVFEGKIRPWWGELDISNDADPVFIQHYWDILSIWSVRLALVLEENISGLSHKSVLWRLKVVRDLTPINLDFPKKSYQEAYSDIEITVDSENNIVTTILNEEFQKSLTQPENIAERALVERTVEGFFELANQKLNAGKKEKIVQEVIQSPQARQSHALPQQEFYDCVPSFSGENQISFEALDNATAKLGLGWQNRKKEDGDVIKGKQECANFLNATVESLEEKLCRKLKLYNRKELILLTLKSHESAAKGQLTLGRTAGAAIALRSNKEQVNEDVLKQQQEYTSIQQLSRLLLEVAMCECPTQGGYTPGKIDISYLMNLCYSVLIYGGWSDSIHWGAMKPEVHISSFGDIQVDHDFIDKVVDPFSTAYNKDSIQDSIKSYEKIFSISKSKEPINDFFAAEFVNAWRQEFKFEIDDMLVLIGDIQSHAIKEEAVILGVPRNKLLTHLSLDNEKATAVLKMLTLSARAKWKQVPEGYDDSDRQLWRFRRRLSLARKPIIQLDDSTNPQLVIAPGMLGYSCKYIIGNYYEGNFPLKQIKSDAMQSWVGKRADDEGKKFNLEVGKKLKNLGWNVKTEIRVSELLRQGFDRDYGDIDVLAWSPSKHRLLLIECKTLKFAKTYGEIAEQLSDFKGGDNSSEKRDLLRKHIDRIDIIKSNREKILKDVKLDDGFSIEGWLIFSNLVPMQFWDTLKEKINVSVLDKLEKDI